MKRWQLVGGLIVTTLTSITAVTWYYKAKAKAVALRTKVEKLFHLTLAGLAVYATFRITAFYYTTRKVSIRSA